MSTRAREQSLVRRRREELGMLLIELAKKAERSPAMISMVEGGFVPTKESSRLKIADALDTTPEALWPDEFGQNGTGS